MTKKIEEPSTLSMLIGRYEKMHLDLDDLAKLMAMTNRKSVQNAINGGWFPIRTMKRGRARVADIRDVAAYLDKARHEG